MRPPSGAPPLGGTAGGFAGPRPGRHLRDLINALGKGGYADTEKQVNAIAATGDSAAVPGARGARRRQSLCPQGGRRGLHHREGGQQVHSLIDPLTAEAVGEAVAGAIDKIKVNNKLRRVIRAAIGGLTLMSPDRRDAAQPPPRRSSRAATRRSIELIDAALEQETDPAIAKLMREARAAAVLNSDASDEDKIAAIEVLKQRGGRDSLPCSRRSREPARARSARPRRRRSPPSRATSRCGMRPQNVWYGLSLGSVLLLAAIGLAITFGVMGVINMAHGEMVMLGAYTTFVVQQVIRARAP